MLEVTDEIRELIQLVAETAVAELEVQRGDNRVRIRRAFGAEFQDVTIGDQHPAATEIVRRPPLRCTVSLRVEPIALAAARSSNSARSRTSWPSTSRMTSPGSRPRS